MLIASQANPQTPVVHLGTTRWAMIPAVPGQPDSEAIEADADFPDLRMHASMTLRKNTDPTLRATHTIDLKFAFQTRRADHRVQGCRSAADAQAQFDRMPRPSTGDKVKISDTLLSCSRLAKRDQPTHARNLDLMRTRAWFDFPLLLNDDRVAKTRVPEVA